MDTKCNNCDNAEMYDGLCYTCFHAAMVGKQAQTAKQNELADVITSLEKQSQLDYTERHTKTIRHNRKRILVEALGERCVDCGHKYHWTAFNFVDTIDGFNVPQAVSRGVNTKTILAKAWKANLICKNCSAKRDWEARK